MPRGPHADRIKKGRHDPSIGSSSQAASGRNLRPRRPKRAAEQEIEEVDEVGNSTSSDDVEDEQYRVEPHVDDDEEEEEEMAADDDDEGAGDDESAEADAPLVLEICRPTGPASRRVTDYLAGGMTDVVRRLRRTSPLDVDRTATDYRFWTLF